MWRRCYEIKQIADITGQIGYVVEYLSGHPARAAVFRTERHAERSAKRLYHKEHGFLEEALGLNEELESNQNFPETNGKHVVE